MCVYDLIFRFNQESSDRLEDVFSDYLTRLSGSNQVIFESMNISGTDGCRTVRATVPFRDSLEEKNNTELVNAAFEKLKPYLAEPVAIEPVGEDFTCGDDFATEEEATSYVLRIHLKLRDFSPICCGQRWGHIPYYLLPALSEAAVAKLNGWETSYAAYDQLFYATGIGEMSAHKMLSQISSPLNQEGLSVCRMLETELGKPVYYYLYRFYGKHRSRCPKCGGAWKAPEGSLFDYQCDACRIVADRTGNK